MKKHKYVLKDDVLERISKDIDLREEIGKLYGIAHTSVRHNALNKSRTLHEYHVIKLIKERYKLTDAQIFKEVKH